MKTHHPYFGYETTEHKTIDEEKTTEPGEGNISFCVNYGEISQL